MKSAFVFLAMSLLVGVSRRPGFAAWQAAAPPLPVSRVTIVNTFPHDRDAFTEGLQFVDGVLYESTGLNGRSSIRMVDLASGRVLQKREVPSQYFGEGIVVWKDHIVHLTYQSGIGFVYDRKTFAPIRSFNYTGEGWGLTHDGRSIIMSDGTEFLRYLDPVTLAEQRRLRVTANGQPLKNLNELEIVKGEIYANVWQTEHIARIDPASGRVKGYIDLRGLLSPREAASVDVLNGIAYDAAANRLFVTGKLWPKIFEITIAN